MSVDFEIHRKIHNGSELATRHLDGECPSYINLVRLPIWQRSERMEELYCHIDMNESVY